MKITWVLGLVLMSATLTGHAEAQKSFPGWTYSNSTEDSDYYVKDQSGNLENGIRSMLVQNVPKANNNDKTVNYRKFTILDKDCQNGYGAVTLYTPSGEFVAKLDYVKGGNSLASGMADILCMVKFAK
ncbi:hypothetical protein [Rahnella]|uniref:hypothetical protein n=1 Tax=Rahnella TaxID=34037 RepID=UPI000E6BE508|nr:hypothetical protein [Rahnella]TBX35858.1 hypothetical protein EYY67_06960 [Rahnella victoriana]TDS97727.1 hypothetical protein EDF78_101102 [Rahnella sp. BIGb0236]